MAYIAPRPILAEDPLAYFAPLVAIPARPVLRASKPVLTLNALEQMYGYYAADRT